MTEDIAATTQTLEAVVASAPIVNLDYIDEFVRRGSLDNTNQDSLQYEATLPDPVSFFPTRISIDGMTLDEAKQCFSPQIDRKALLKGVRLVFATQNSHLNKVRILCSKACTYMLTIVQSLDKSAHVFELAGATVERCTDDVLRRLGDVPSALRFISQNIREADHSSSESFESGNIRPDGLQAHLIIISAATDAGEPWCISLKKASKEYV